MNISILILQLIKKNLAGKLSFEEREILNEWEQEDEDHLNFIKNIDNETIDLDDVLLWMKLDLDNEAFKNKLEEKTLNKINQESSEIDLISNQKPTKINYILFAASILLFITFGSLFFLQKTKIQETQAVVNLDPGKFYGTIQLPDGKIISLSEANPSLILSDQLKKEDGTIISGLEDSQKQISMQTGKGNYFHLTLSDGTKLWLNADSKVILPAKFVGDQRVVALEGEAYFEVTAKFENGKRIPFIVKTKDQEIEVLGTSFNVSAYEEQMITQTTLVEGSVEVSTDADRILLQTGEQSILSNQIFSKRKVDVYEYNSWIKNEFYFNETNISTAMSILGRWYDFEIEFAGSVPEVYFYGAISRTKTLNEVLDILKSSSLNFKLEKNNQKNKLIVLHN